MATIANMNIAFTAATHYMGFLLFELKEVLVASGWSVIGSSDADALYAVSGYTAGLAAPDQGSGGAFDAWKTGSLRTSNTPAVASDAGNASAWCWLRHNNRDLLLAMPTGPASRNVRILGTVQNTSFDGSVATVTVLPGPPTTDPNYEFGISGTSARSSADGDQIINVAATMLAHIVADDVVSHHGDLGFFSCVTSSSASATVYSFFGQLPYKRYGTIGESVYYQRNTSNMGGTSIGVWNTSRDQWVVGGGIDTTFSAFFHGGSGSGPGNGTDVGDGSIFCTSFDVYDNTTVPVRPLGVLDGRFVVRSAEDMATDSVISFGTLRYWTAVSNANILYRIDDVVNPSPAVVVPFTGRFVGSTGALPTNDPYTFAVVNDVQVPETLRLFGYGDTTLVSSVTSVFNRVWDTVAGGFHIWETPTPDPTGTFYDGPGTYGVHTSNYSVI